MNSEALPIRPYARLLTMLGDQLIKNERIPEDAIPPEQPPRETEP